MAKDGREWVEKVQSEEVGGRARVMEFYSEYTRIYLWSSEQESDMICKLQKYYVIVWWKEVMCILQWNTLKWKVERPIRKLLEKSRWNDESFGKGGGSECSERWLDSVYILKVKQIFTHGFGWAVYCIITI